MRRTLLTLAWMAYCLAVLKLVPELLGAAADFERAIAPTTTTGAAAAGPAAFVDGAAWFRWVRGSCTPDGVDAALAGRPAPAGADGASWEAACLALAGRIGEARARILELPAARRYQGAGTVFEVVHPVADGGDEVAAGPAMELVVEFWPNHYQALYHAGAARFETGDRTAAREYLERFLELYQAEDRWTARAREMLGR